MVFILSKFYESENAFADFVLNEIDPCLVSQFEERENFIVYYIDDKELDGKTRERFFTLLNRDAFNRIYQETINLCQPTTAEP